MEKSKLSKKKQSKTLNTSKRKKIDKRTNSKRLVFLLHTRDERDKTTFRRRRRRRRRAAPFLLRSKLPCLARRKKPKPGGVSSSTGGLRCGGRGRGRGFLSFLFFLRTGKKRDDDVQTRTTLERRRRRRRRRTFFEVLWLALNRRVCFGSSGTRTNSKRDAGTRASSGIVDRDRA